MHIEIANIFDLNGAAPLFDQYRVFYGKQSDLDAAKRFLSERPGRRPELSGSRPRRLG